METTLGSSSRQRGSLVLLLLGLSALAHSLPTSPLLAHPLPPHAGEECLGCPPGALEVTVHLEDGTVEYGLIEIHASQVAAVVDVKPFPAEAAALPWKDRRVELWQRTFNSQQVFQGPNYRLTAEPQGNAPTRLQKLTRLEGEATFTLPLLFLKEPLTFSFSEIAWIEDRSIIEGFWAQLGKPYPVDPQVACKLLGEAVTVIEIQDHRDTDNGLIHGLSLDRRMDPDELARLCVEKAGWNQLWSEEGVVCINVAGST